MRSTGFVESYRATLFSGAFIVAGHVKQGVQTQGQNTYPNKANLFALSTYRARSTVNYYGH